MNIPDSLSRILTSIQLSHSEHIVLQTLIRTVRYRGLKSLIENPLVNYSKYMITQA